MFSGRVKVKILLLADFLKGPFDSWCCQVDFEFEVKGCSLGYIIYPIMILRIFSYNVKTFLFFCCGLLVAQTTHVMIQIIDAQSCEKSIFFVSFFWVDIRIYIYAHDVIYCDQYQVLVLCLFPIPPLTMLWSTETVVFSPKKAWCVRLGTWCQGQGGCAVFFLEASRPGKKTPLLKKIKTEIFGSGVIGLQYIEKYIAAPVPTYWFILTPLLVPTKIGIGHAHLSGTLRCPKPFLEEISNDRKSTCHFFNTTGGGSEKEKKLQNT